MRTLFLTFCGIALLGVDGLVAQTSPDPPSATAKAVAGVVASIELTGCLERWSTVAAPSPSGEPPEAPAGVEFVITNVEGQASASPKGGGRSATKTDEARYLLMPSPSMDLASHLNHKVKVSGTIAPQPSEGASPAERIADPSRSETNLPSGPTSEAFRLNLVEVSTVTMVSRTCGKRN